MKSSLVFFCCLIVSACSSTYKVPSARVLSPESEGKGEGTISLGLHSFEEATITSDIIYTAVDSSAHSVETLHTLSGTGLYGVMESLDVGVVLNLGVLPVILVKYQFLGDSKRKAHERNVSLSGFFGLGYDGSQADTGTDTLFGTENTGTVQREANWIYTLGGLSGYRITKQMLGIFGFSRVWQDISGYQTRSAAPSRAYFSSHSTLNEFHFGLNVKFNENASKVYFFQPEIQRGWLDTFGNQSYFTTYQLDFGFQY